MKSVLEKNILRYYLMFNTIKWMHLLDLTLLFNNKTENNGINWLFFPQIDSILKFNSG